MPVGRAVRKYKLVPVEPTPAMIKAAEHAYMPFGDMELAIQMAILEAPDVRGWPAVFDEDAALTMAERTFSTEIHEQLAVDIVQYAQRLHALYTTLQPVPDAAGLVEALREAELTLELLQGRGSSVKLTLSIIERALAAYRNEIKS